MASTTFASASAMSTVAPLTGPSRAVGVATGVPAGVEVGTSVRVAWTIKGATGETNNWTITELEAALSGAGSAVAVGVTSGSRTSTLPEMDPGGLVSVPFGGRCCATNPRASCSTLFRSGHASSSRPVASHAVHVATDVTDIAVRSMRKAVNVTRSEPTTTSAVLRPRESCPCTIVGMMPHKWPHRVYDSSGMQSGVPV